MGDVLFPGPISPRSICLGEKNAVNEYLYPHVDANETIFWSACLERHIEIYTRNTILVSGRIMKFRNQLCSRFEFNIAGGWPCRSGLQQVTGPKFKR